MVTNDGDLHGSKVISHNGAAAEERPLCLIGPSWSCDKAFSTFLFSAQFFCYVYFDVCLSLQTAKHCCVASQKLNVLVMLVNDNSMSIIVICCVKNILLHKK